MSLIDDQFMFEGQKHEAIAELKKLGPDDAFILFTIKNSDLDSVGEVLVSKITVTELLYAMRCMSDTFYSRILEALSK